jgi:hypothetical protein
MSRQMKNVLVLALLCHGHAIDKRKFLQNGKGNGVQKAIDFTRSKIPFRDSTVEVGLFGGGMDSLFEA